MTPAQRARLIGIMTAIPVVSRRPAAGACVSSGQTNDGSHGSEDGKQQGLPAVGPDTSALVFTFATTTVSQHIRRRVSPAAGALFTDVRGNRCRGWVCILHQTQVRPRSLCEQRYRSPHAGVRAAISLVRYGV